MRRAACVTWVDALGRARMGRRMSGSELSPDPARSAVVRLSAVREARGPERVVAGAANVRTPVWSALEFLGARERGQHEAGLVLLQRGPWSRDR